MNLVKSTYTDIALLILGLMIGFTTALLIIGR